MSDRTSAELFADIFRMLAAEPERYKELAFKIWKMTSCYDFHPIQMNCPEALEALRLATRLDDEPYYIWAERINNSDTES